MLGNIQRGEKIDQPYETTCSRMCGCFSHKNHAEKDQISNQNMRACCEKTANYALTLLSLAGIGTSASLLTPLIDRIATSCFEAEITSQTAFNECNQPHTAHLILYHSLLSISCLILGYQLQKIWEKKPAISETSSLTASLLASTKNSPSENKEISFSAPISIIIKNGIQHIQNYYRYEIILGMIYMYNGFWIPVHDVNSFKGFLSCAALGVGAFSSVGGMYIRSQLLYLQTQFLNLRKEMLANTESTNSLKKRLISFITVGVSVSAVGWGFTAKEEENIPISTNIHVIAREIGLLFLSRLLANYLTLILDQYDVKKNSHSLLSFSRIIASFLDLQVPILLGGYSIYLFSDLTPIKYLGLVLVGVTQGTKERRYFSNKQKIEHLAMSHEATSLPILSRCISLMKSYWKTMGLLCFAIASQKLQFLSCEGDPTPFNYSCPIGLELSGYLSGNQVVLNSSGVNIAILVGLSNFYFRRILRSVEKATHQESLKNIFAKSYISFTNKMEYPFLSMIPYALIKSEQLWPSYDNSLYVHNPIAPLVLIGFTFGNYKEQAGFC